jgi:hypothetical protein
MLTVVTAVTMVATCGKMIAVTVVTGECDGRGDSGERWQWWQ